MEELLRRARQGDQQATEQLVADYKGLVRSLANKFYLVGGDKDDLLQEGTLGLIYAINKYDENKGAFPAFAELCVMRQILGAIKHDSGIKQKPLSNYVDIETVSGFSDGLNSPLEILLQKEYYERVTKVVNEQLTPIERRVLTMFAEGYSYEDISKMLSRSYKSVDGALQRARKKLIEYLN